MNLSNWFSYCWALLLALLGTHSRAAAPTDSLSNRQLTHWPLATQLRLASKTLTPLQASVADSLARRAELNPAVRAQLLIQLGRHFFYYLQPNLALIRLLQCDQLLTQHPDSARRSEMSAELSYAYQWTKQYGAARRWGHAAVRFAAGTQQLALQSRGYSMLALCAEAEQDYAAQLRYLAQSMRLNRRAERWRPLFMGHSSMFAATLRLHQPAQAQRHLDSMRLYLPRFEAANARGNSFNPEFYRLLLAQLQAELWLANNRPRPAAQLLRVAAGRARYFHDDLEEIELRLRLIKALTRLNAFREALEQQQRITQLKETLFDENNSRRAQEYQALYQAREQERELSQQRRRIDGLQAQARLREAESRQQRLLFGAALLGALLMLGGLVAYQRARHALAARAAAQQMRTRIAADLHDEVGTLLTRVSMQADMLRQLQPGSSPALDRLLTNTRAAAGIMRDIVWGIDAEADTVGALLDRMREFLRQSTTAAGLEAELHADDCPDEILPQLLRQQTYLIFKEAVTNAIKHARGATQLDVQLRHAAGHLRLTVTDDGQPLAAATGPSTGLGLRSMRQRAESLGGTLTAGPRPGGGFRVTLEAPLQWD